MCSAAVEQPFLTRAGHPSPAEFRELVNSGEVLEHRGDDRPSLIRLESTGVQAQVLMVKLWYPKKLWSSDRLRPYSERFRRNAALLAERDVIAPEVVGWGRLQEPLARFVSYPEIPGTPLRDLPGSLDLDALAGFLIRLHEAGIAFRALHLGNVLKTASDFALIDIGDCRFSSSALSLRQRAKNLGGLCAHPTDAARFGNGAWSGLVISYARQALFTLDEAAALHHRVRAHVRRWDQRRARQRRR